jgi:adenosylhomocysteinase
MQVDETLVQEFIAAGGRWKQYDEIKDETFDIHLDCAAELMSRIPPKIGTVEITGTGSNKYESIKANYPIISVDKSKIKNLEGVLGTGEAFVRAFETLTKEDLSNKNFMVFGYGKVGKGIAHYLSKKTKNIIVIDKIPENIQKAKLAGFEGYLSDNKTKIEELAPKMFGIVTATGIKNVISDNYDGEAFKVKYLANMGAEDEFGYKFTSSEVMCEKRPINFFIEKPTLMRYLDPVFYAHNQGVDLLVYSNLSNGLHSFPKFISIEVVNEWEAIFNENVNI